jgi:hypothetical protein
MEPQSVHAAVTSPPYFGVRDYGTAGQLGLEESVEAHVENMVSVFRELRRVLRDDGVLWVNYGDSYASNPASGGPPSSKLAGPQNATPNRIDWHMPPGYTAGNQLLVPHRFALAMQADGWVLRDTIIWAKGGSFGPWVGAVMPESLNGTRWERCRVKTGERVSPATVGGMRSGRYLDHIADHESNHSENRGKQTLAGWADCPGCPRCAPNDGLVLRRGSWRTTDSHEYVFMFVKAMGYYADREAVAESAEFGRREWSSVSGNMAGIGVNGSRGHATVTGGDGGTRNLRSVWQVPEPLMRLRSDLSPSDRAYVLDELRRRGL